ncbi:MAG: lycopene cyclase domain-containing protein [Cyclobacteriaceae bacterium]|nr:lycopene cyclase domain-containing protein [Cyclobacteriaceae bacterium]
MQSYLYLFIDLASILLPLLFSFHPKISLAHQWRSWLPALLFPALIFIAWDMWFTSMGVWSFNPRYLTGLTVGNLPLEEVLFFLCIPYSCLFVYVVVKRSQTIEPLPDHGRRITWVLIAGLTVTGLKYLDQWYTVVTFLALATFLLIHLFLIRSTYLGRFYFSYLFILIPFFIVNGILTGSLIDEPVVFYNDWENLRIRIGTIPFEDIFYGMLLILMNVSIFEYRTRLHQAG